MRKLLSATLIVAMVAGLAVATLGPSASGQVTCEGEFPHWTAGATTEEENEARIACVKDRRHELKQRERAIADRIEQRRDRIAEIRERIDADQVRRRAVRRQVTAYDLLLRGLVAMRGIVANLAAIRSCESGGNYEETPEENTGNYDGAYQFDGPTYRSNQEAAGVPEDREVSRSYLGPSWLQDWVAAVLRHARGTQPWPRCGV